MRQAVHQLIVGLFLLLQFSFACANESTIKVTRDLQQDGHLSAQLQRPLVILFSIRNCEFCEFIREEFLQPMQENSIYNQKIIIREVRADSQLSVRDFNGEKVAVDRISNRYHAAVAPTLVFLDGQGKELADGIIGITSVELYDIKLGQAITAAIKKLSSNPAEPPL